MKCVHVRPNVWVALESATNCLVRAVATLCRLAWLENLHVLAATLSFDVDVSHHPLPFVAPYFVP